jgi:membrane fusion protein (multidrug efflux system)
MTSASMTTVPRYALVSFLALALFGCKKDDKPEEAAAHPEVTATTIVVAPQAFTETLGAIGTVVSRAGHSATLSAPAAGRVARIMVTSGQSVRAGQTLIELDQAPFRTSLESAQAALAAAERANERQQRLAQEGIVPRKDAEQAAADVARARAEATAARRAEQLSVLKSPISGVVTRMSATLGAAIDPAVPIVEISDPSALDLLLSVTPTDAARVHPGAKVSVSAGESAAGEPLGTATVVDVAGTVDTTTRSVAVRARIPSSRRPLRIGETVFGAIAVGSRPAAIVVPADALVPEGEGFKVFVVDATGTAHEREVKVGGRTAASVEILEGLKAGERVVTSGAYGMQDSAKVVAPKPDSAKAEKEGDEAPSPPSKAKP